MLAKAFENGQTYGGHILRVVHADWRWLNRDVHGEFDAVICLGNSFTHLFSEQDRRKALAEFYAVLKHDGILILDQRNYDAILDNGFSSKHTYYYCGESVSAEPEYVDEGLARFSYRFPDDSQYHLNMFPLRRDYTRRLLREVGFQRVDTYGDFQETFSDGRPDFFIHVVEKHYRKDEPVSETYSTAVHTARDREKEATARATDLKSAPTATPGPAASCSTAYPPTRAASWRIARYSATAWEGRWCFNTS
jgi:sarcosine/dimethylglycine N-methyltransferase